MNRQAALYQGVALSALLGVALVLSACGGVASGPLPTAFPTATPTPRSTPLPEVPTEVPLATAGNPLVILMLPQAGRLAAEDASQTLEALILDLAGLMVDIQPVNSYGEIVAQLCSANPVVGWVDGLAYVVAEAQGCADPALLVERGGATGFSVDLLAASELSATDPGDLEGRTLCRLNSEDVASWFLPGLMLQTEGVNPLYDLEGVVEVEDYDALVAAIYDGACDAGGVPRGYLDDVGGEVAAREDLREVVAVLAGSPEVPYDLLVYPQTVPLNVRIPLNDVFVELAASDQNAAILYDILAQDAILRVTRVDLAAFRAFMDDTGLNFAALGE